MSNALNAHGALLAIEKDGDPAATFTTVAETMDFDSILDLSREASEVTPHNDTVSTHTFGPLVHGEWSFSVNLVFDDGTHDESTGLQKLYYDGDEFGMRFRGPSGSSGSHEIIVSGQLTNLSRSYPTGADPVTMDVTFQPVGKFIVEGTEFGSTGATQS